MTGTTEAVPRSTGYPGYTLNLNRALEAAREARSLVRVSLAVWGLEDHTDTAALVMSELVTNAVRHACGPTLRVCVDRPKDTLVYLAVVDRAPGQLPKLRDPAPGDIGGRGLLLVEECAIRWGYDLLGSRPWGKRVWVEMAVAL